MKFKNAKTPQSKLDAQKAYRDNKRGSPEWVESQRAYMAEYKEGHAERIIEVSRVRYQRVARDVLLSKYGITTEDYENLLTEQGNVCAICGGTATGRWNTFAVDHDHESGQVRGLLCNTCNVALGLFQDRVENLERAARYLRKFYQEKPSL